MHLEKVVKSIFNIEGNRNAKDHKAVKGRGFSEIKRRDMSSKKTV